MEGVLLLQVIISKTCSWFVCSAITTMTSWSRDLLNWTKRKLGTEPSLTYGVSVLDIAEICATDSHFVRTQQWETFAYRLGLAESDIQEIRLFRCTDVTQIILKVLQKWVSLNGTEAIVSKLCRDLQKQKLKHIKDEILRSYPPQAAIVFNSNESFIDTSGTTSYTNEHTSDLEMDTLESVNTWQADSLARTRAQGQQNSPESSLCQSISVQVHPNAVVSLGFPVSKSSPKRNEVFTLPSVVLPPVPDLCESMGSVAINTEEHVLEEPLHDDEIVIENVPQIPFGSDNLVAKNIVTEYSKGKLEAYETRRSKILKSVGFKPMKIKLRLAACTKRHKKDKNMIREYKREMCDKMQTSQKFLKPGYKVYD